MSENGTCRICGEEPKPHEELTDGLCPDCCFEREVLTDGGTEQTDTEQESVDYTLERKRHIGCGGPIVSDGVGGLWCSECNEEVSELKTRGREVHTGTSRSGGDGE